ncbi:hypothetical protein ACOSQ4_017920 [Xanthoceras sorbifolium]
MSNISFVMMNEIKFERSFDVALLINLNIFQIKIRFLYIKLEFDFKLYHLLANFDLDLLSLFSIEEKPLVRIQGILGSTRLEGWLDPLPFGNNFHSMKNFLFPLQLFLLFPFFL